MINYTCVKCNVEMRCLKNSIPVIHFMNNNKSGGIDVVAFGDMYICPKCGNKIVGGFGRPTLGYDLPEGYLHALSKEEYVEIKR